MQEFNISNKYYNLDEVFEGLNSKLVLSKESAERISFGRQFLEDKLEASDRPIYGINTGFGSLCNTEISKDALAELQVNLVRSHACGVGNTIPEHVSKLIFLLKIIGLSKGNSGVSLDLIEHMIDMYNAGAVPVIYEYGSLGASGDLAPLAHLALILIGEGELWENGKKVSASEWLKTKDIKPIGLKAKEGISLLNGTQFMSAFGLLSCIKFSRLLNLANHSAALSLEAFSGSLAPFIEELHQLRNHNGQVYISREINRILEGSESIQTAKAFVQDPYSFRCIPQVHGASYSAMQHVRDVVEREINAVTDNPTLLFEADRVVSGGNFHGQPLALAFEYAAIASAEIGSISERRVYKLISGERGLPAFLVQKPGLNSGFMIPQYTAASLVNKNKQLCAPCAVDTIDSSNGQEDHVSMGANSATKLYQILYNLHHILAIECLAAAQAYDCLGAPSTSSVLKDFYENLRSEIPFMEKDAVLHNFMTKSHSFTKHYFDLYI